MIIVDESENRHTNVWRSENQRIGERSDDRRTMTSHMNLLRGSNITDTQIMWLLRWKSNAFMTYLRNVAVLAHKQTIAFSDVEAMPQII
jgi:hypothetical protein